MNGPGISKTPSDTGKGSEKVRHVLLESPVSELIDRITILELKLQHAEQGSPPQDLQDQFNTLNSLFRDLLPDLTTEGMVQLCQLRGQLSEINSKLWDIEDSIRAMDKCVFPEDHWCGNCAGEGASLDSEIVREYCYLARSVYVTNDKRGRVKKLIDEVTGSRYQEHKNYADYSGTIEGNSRG